MARPSGLKPASVRSSAGVESPVWKYTEKMFNDPCTPASRRTAARPGKRTSKWTCRSKSFRKSSCTVMPTPATAVDGPGDHHDLQPGGFRQSLHRSAVPWVSDQHPTSWEAISRCTFLDLSLCRSGSRAKSAWVFQETREIFPVYCPEECPASTPALGESAPSPTGWPSLFSESERPRAAVPSPSGSGAPNARRRACLRRMWRGTSRMG